MQKTISAGDPQTTITGTTSDTAQSLSDLGANLTVESLAMTKIAIYAEVFIETNPVRMGFNSVSTSLGKLLYPGDHIKLEGANEVSEARFISAIAGIHGTLQITTEF